MRAKQLLHRDFHDQHRGYSEECCWFAALDGQPHKSYAESRSSECKKTTPVANKVDMSLREHQTVSSYVSALTQFRMLGGCRRPMKFNSEVQGCCNI